MDSYATDLGFDWIPNGLILNQVCRQVSRKIGDKQSVLTSDGITFPPDIIEILIWEFLYETWVVPFDLLQDICLLSISGTTGDSRHILDRDIPDCISTSRSTMGNLESDGRVIGQWYAVGGYAGDVGAGRRHNPDVMGKSDYRFITSLSSPPACSVVYGDEHEEIMKEFMGNANLSKVQILNHMRSIECPVLGIKNSPTDPDRGLSESQWETPDFMEMRELTENDARHREVGSFEEAKLIDKVRLDSVLDEIILNDKEMMHNGYRKTHGAGTHNGIVWNPSINGPGYITIITR